MAVLVSPANLLEPVTVRVPVPPWFSVGYVWMPPPMKERAVEFSMLIVPVPVTIRLVGVITFQAVELPSDQVPAPIATVFASVVPEEKATPPLPIVTLYPLASKVPAVKTIAEELKLLLL